MTDRLTISGHLSKADAKAFARASRSGVIGPTSIYYAGVTAPAIAAAMGTLVTAVLAGAGTTGLYAFLGGTIVAAMAGISWYLIFMRWANQEQFGRRDEIDNETRVEVDSAGVRMRRGGIMTFAEWSAVTDIEVHKRFIAIRISGADDVVIASDWFGFDGDRTAFIDRATTLLSQQKAG